MKTMAIKMALIFAATLLGCSADTFVGGDSGDSGDPGDGSPKDFHVVGLDSGDASGGDGEPGQDAGLEAETGPSFKRVFISSTKTASNFGGLAAADAICTTAAAGAGLGGTWKAWISTSSTSAASRLSHSSVPYQLVDGTLVASSWSALISGVPLKSAIDLDERGNYIPFSYPIGTAWTGTASDGGSTTTTCSDWTMTEDCTVSTSLTGTVGSDGNVDSRWTSYGEPACCTVQSFALFCFEQ